MNHKLTLIIKALAAMIVEQDARAKHKKGAARLEKQEREMQTNDKGLKPVREPQRSRSVEPL
jgi:hypothetical protein